MLIGISGKLNSGKDTIGLIIQWLTSSYIRDLWLNEFEVYLDEAHKFDTDAKWEIRKYADKLKDIVCLLIGCTREQLEDGEFKEKELGEEWWYYKASTYGLVSYNSKYKDNEGTDRVNLGNVAWNVKEFSLIKLTPRLLLQLLGTECGREIIHPNIWVNALMSEYKGVDLYRKEDPLNPWLFPNWIITDVRFPNELKAIKDRKGITIRVNRFPKSIWISTAGHKIPVEIPFDRTNHKHLAVWRGTCMQQHESEKALDNAEFDYVIENDGTIAQLTEKISIILNEHKLL